MDCPVCNHKGIPESLRQCPNCHTDLTIFRNINRLNREVKAKQQVIIGMGFLLVVVLAVLGYMFLFSDGFSSRYTRMEIQAKNDEIMELRKQNTELQQELFDLRQGEDTTEGEGFRRVIPSSEDDQSDTSDQNARRTSAERTQSRQSPAENRSSTEPSDKPEVVYHNVKAGETLYSIARKYFDDGSKHKKIMDDNGIDDPSDVKVGTRLKIIKE
ncbi:MAG: LysM peptidoglycan-binding domain-containing protein [Bacteroidota bacterium]